MICSLHWWRGAEGGREEGCEGEWPLKRQITRNLAPRIYCHFRFLQELYGWNPLIKVFNNLPRDPPFKDAERLKSWGDVYKPPSLSWQTFCVNQHQTVGEKRTNTWLNTRQIQRVDVYVTGGPLVSRRLLLNQGNLHLINTELKSIVILIKDTGLDSPLYSSAPESGLGFNFIWFTASAGSTPIWIVCSDAGLTFHKAACAVGPSIYTSIFACYWPLCSLSCSGNRICFFSSKSFLKWTLTVAVA